MELTWRIQLRIAAVAAIGILLIGIFAWPLAAPADPLSPVLAPRLGFGGAVLLLGLASLVGFASYFAAWPHGREIGILAVPAGLAVWAGRAGSMASLMQLNSSSPDRQAALAAVRFESVLWLAVAAAGFAGVVAAERLVRAGATATTPELDATPTPRIRPATVAVGLLAATIICLLGLPVFARDLSDGSPVAASGQPPFGQIVFAIIVTFGAAAFVLKLLLGLSYIWPAASSVLVSAYYITSYLHTTVLERFVSSIPAPFFPASACSITPIQMVTFACIGSVTGYWTAVRYDYWRRHEST